MATVYIPATLQSLSGGQTQVTVEAASVRQVVARLEALFPGMEEALVEDGELKPYIVVAVDGDFSVLGLTERVGADSEVHFIPALGGGAAERSLLPPLPPLTGVGISSPLPPGEG
jgi:molybdopterin synthase sulfur carrier subunit